MSPRHDAYRGIARHYDRNLMDWYATTYGRRLLDEIARRGRAGARVLDAGCGTGTLALLLAREGYRVTGIDLSPALLEIARAKDAAGAVTWVEGDLTDFDLGQGFDIVVSVGDVLNHLETLDAWERAFRSLATHLAQGGLLFFDVMTAKGLERLDTYSIQDRADGAMLLGIVYEHATRRSTLKLTTFAPVAGTGLWERASETIPEWGQPVDGIVERLGRAGFVDIERMWPIADDAEVDERLAILCRLGPYRGI